MSFFQVNILSCMDLAFIRVFIIATVEIITEDNKDLDFKISRMVAINLPVFREHQMDSRSQCC